MLLDVVGLFASKIHEERKKHMLTNVPQWDEQRHTVVVGGSATGSALDSDQLRRSVPSILIFPIRSAINVDCRTWYEQLRFMFVLRDLLCLCHTLLEESLQNGLLGEVSCANKGLCNVWASL